MHFYSHTFILCFCTLFLGAFPLCAQDFLPGVIFIKVKKEKLNRFKENINTFDDSYGQLDVLEIEAVVKPREDSRRSWKSSIDQVFRLHVPQSTDIIASIELLEKHPFIEFASPSPIYQVLYTPNDPLADSSLGSAGQLQLQAHNFYKAWEYEKGDTNVVIGVVDTGIDFEHEDVQENLFINYKDPIDSINNDFDTYKSQDLIDNYRGWDIADRDNDPSVKGGTHGHEVTGVLGATPDNELGIAGTGYHCKFMPIKATWDVLPKNVTHGYDGLMYAAEQGCNVINLSWRGLGYESSREMMQEFIDYAVLDHDAVIVAAAGNSGKEEEYFPAGLEGVISVASVDRNRVKQSMSTYDSTVDIAAVGVNVRTTKNSPSSYHATSGTSIATAVVSGAAALVRSKYPHLRAQEVIDLLVESGDVIDTVAGNEAYAGKIGRFLNPVRALNGSMAHLIATDYALDQDHKDHIVDQEGDTILFYPKIITDLPVGSGVNVSIVAESDNFSIVEGACSLPAINLGDTVTSITPLTLYIHPSYDTLETLSFTLEFESPEGEAMGDDSLSASLKPTLITGEISFTPQPKTTISPNPFEESITINLASSEERSISLFSQTGQILFSRLEYEETINLEMNELNLQSGVYILKIETDTETEVHRVIKR